MAGSDMRVVFIGHATLLIELGDVRILTDPNFDFWLDGAPRIGGMLSRVSPPGIALADLPPIDAILLSHAHVDHLSFRTLARLARGTPIIAPPAIARWLRRRGHADAVPLAPGESATLGTSRVPVTITAASARHFGCRYFVDWWRAAVNMYLLAASERTCLFVGDSGPSSAGETAIAELLRVRGRPLDVALLPISHAPWWEPGFHRAHLTPLDALRVSERLRARFLVPHHWGAFNFIDSGAFDAVARLRRALASRRTSVDVRIIEPGESLVVATRLRRARTPGSTPAAARSRGSSFESA